MAVKETGNTEPGKKKTKWSKVGTILMYGWMPMLIFILVMVIVISTLLQKC